MISILESKTVTHLAICYVSSGPSSDLEVTTLTYGNSRFQRAPRSLEYGRTVPRLGVDTVGGRRLLFERGRHQYSSLARNSQTCKSRRFRCRICQAAWTRQFRSSVVSPSFTLIWTAVWLNSSQRQMVRASGPQLQHNARQHGRKGNGKIQ